jgi:hypothetical protein
MEENGTSDSMWQHIVAGLLSHTVVSGFMCTTGGSTGVHKVGIINM